VSETTQTGNPKVTKYSQEELFDFQDECVEIISTRMEEMEELADSLGWEFVFEFCVNTFFFQRKSDRLCVFSSPFYEGDDGLSMQISTEDGDSLCKEWDNIMLPFKYDPEEPSEDTFVRYKTFMWAFLKLVPEPKDLR
jgi:hypothetical protein